MFNDANFKIGSDYRSKRIKVVSDTNNNKEDGDGKLSFTQCNPRMDIHHEAENFTAMVPYYEPKKFRFFYENSAIVFPRIVGEGPKMNYLSRLHSFA